MSTPSRADSLLLLREAAPPCVRNTLRPINGWTTNKSVPHQQTSPGNTKTRRQLRQRGGKNSIRISTTRSSKPAHLDVRHQACHERLETPPRHRRRAPPHERQGRTSRDPDGVSGGLLFFLTGSVLRSRGDRPVLLQKRPFRAVARQGNKRTPTRHGNDWFVIRSRTRAAEDFRSCFALEQLAHHGGLLGKKQGRPPQEKSSSARVWVCLLAIVG